MTIVAIVLTTLMISIYRNTKISNVLLPVNCAFVIIGYCLGIAGALRIWNVLACLFIFIDITAFVLHIKNANKSGIDVIKEIRYEIPLGIVFFTIYYVIIIVACKGVKVIDWDDLGHWGTTLKQTYYLNAIPVKTIAASNYNDYPPASNIWLNLFLVNFKTYREELVFGIWNMIIGMCFIPFWERIDTSQNVSTNVIHTILCTLLPFALSFTSFLNLKVDWLVAAMTIYVLCRLADTEHFDYYFYIDMTLVLSVLVLCKAVAIVLALLCMVAILICMIYERAKICSFVQGFAGGAAVIAAYYSWKTFCRINGNHSYITESFGNLTLADYKESLKNLIKYAPKWLDAFIVLFLIIYVVEHFELSKKMIDIMTVLTSISTAIIFLLCELPIKWSYISISDTSSAAYITNHYWDAFCTWGINSHYETNTWFGLSSMEIIALIWLTITMLKKYMDTCMYRKYLIIMDCLIVILCVYVIAHLSMYQSMFSGDESLILSAFNRYLAMILEPLIGINIYYVLVESDKLKTAIGNTICLCEIIIVVLMINLPYVLIMSGITMNDSVSEMKQSALSAQIIEKNVSKIIGGGNENDYDLLSCGGNKEANYMRYYMLPLVLRDSPDISEFAEDDWGKYFQEHDEKYIILDTMNMNNTARIMIDTAVGNSKYRVEGTSENLIVLYKE